MLQVTMISEATVSQAAEYDVYSFKGTTIIRYSSKNIISNDKSLSIRVKPSQLWQERKASYFEWNEKKWEGTFIKNFDKH